MLDWFHVLGPGEIATLNNCCSLGALYVCFLSTWGRFSSLINLYYIWRYFAVLCWISLLIVSVNLENSIPEAFLLAQVMFACAKYNLVHEFFRKLQKFSIPNALTYKGILLSFFSFTCYHVWLHYDNDFCCKQWLWIHFGKKVKQMKLFWLFNTWKGEE